MSGEIEHNTIKPGSCPNSLNAVNQSGHGKAVLPAAILGTADFDVHDIDPTTITLNGVSPIRWNYNDVGTPVNKDGDSCACTDSGSDGFEDLTLKFDRYTIVSSLNTPSMNLQGNSADFTEGVLMKKDRNNINANLKGKPSRDSYVLRVEGQLEDGSIFEGYDCVLLITKDDAIAATINETRRELELIGNHPNPFNPMTQIRFYLPDAAHVTIDIYNVLGQRIECVADGVMESGEHVLEWNGSSVASGVYLYRLTAGDFVDTKKMILLK